MVLEGLVGLGVALLLGTALAEYSKFRHKSEKGWNWIALGGTWLLFAGTFSPTSALAGYIGSAVLGGIGSIFEVLGWLFALIGAIFVAYETLVASR